MAVKQRICVGEIATVHGVRGLVKVRSYGDDIETLEQYGKLFTSETGDKALKLSIKHQAGGAWVAEIEGINDRNIAETYRGTQLWIDRAALPELDDGYYQEDLIDLEVRNAGNTVIGKILSVQNFGASDLIEIQPADGGKVFFLPFVDDYVPVVNLDDGFVTVDIPEGWLDE